METGTCWWKTVLVAAPAVLFIASGSSAQELGTKGCAELIRMAHNCRQDIKTVDIVLGSAIEAGRIDRIRSYKLRKSAQRKRLASILKAIQTRECVAGK